MTARTRKLVMAIAGVCVVIAAIALFHRVATRQGDHTAQSSSDGLIAANAANQHSRFMQRSEGDEKTSPGTDADQTDYAGVLKKGKESFLQAVKDFELANAAVVFEGKA